MTGKANGKGLADKARQRPEYLLASLQRLSGASGRLIVCFLTLPVYAVTLWILSANGHDGTGFMYIYMALWAPFAIDMIMRKCPRCGEQFFVKYLILRPFSRRCAHCGLSRESVAATAASGLAKPASKSGADGS